MIVFVIMMVTDPCHSGEVDGRHFRSVLLSSGFPVSAVEVALISRQFSGGISTVDYSRFMKFATTGACLLLLIANSMLH